MKKVMYVVVMLLTVFSIPAHALIGKADYVDPDKVNPYDFYVMCKCAKKDLLRKYQRLLLKVQT